MKRVILVLALAGCASVVAFAQAPKTVDQVPGYPGATLVSEKPTKEERASAPAWMFMLERVSTTTASAEQVAQFYASKLGVPLEQEGGADPNELEPGQLSPVASGIEYWDQGWIDESADAVKAGFQKRARLPGAETWITGAGFSWAYKNAEKDPYSFTLTIRDKSVTEEDPSRYAPLTEIRLSVQMTNRDKMTAQWAQMQKDAAASSTQTPEQYQASQKAWAADMQAREKAFDAYNAEKKAAADKVRAEMGRTPTEKQLGAAIYPGARYQAELSQDETSYLQFNRKYIFEVAAAKEAVTQFYVKRTGNPVALRVGQLIVIPINFYTPAHEGDTPAMKDSVNIGGPTKTGTTVIMFIVENPDAPRGEAAGR